MGFLMVPTVQIFEFPALGQDYIYARQQHLDSQVQVFVRTGFELVQAKGLKLEIRKAETCNGFQTEAAGICPLQKHLERKSGCRSHIGQASRSH